MIFALGLALSPWGTGVLLEQGQQRGWYSYEAAQGAPLDRLRIDGLRLEAGPASVSVAEFELAWADDCLLSGRLCIDRLAVRGLSVRLAAGDPAVDDETPAAEAADDTAPISLPFPIELRALSLEDIDIRLADGTRLYWASFTSGATAEGSDLELHATQLAGLRVMLPLTPGARLALPADDDATPRIEAAAIDAAIAAQSPLPAQAAAELEGLASVPLEERERIALPEISLPLNVSVPSLEILDSELQGPVEYRVERLALAVSAVGQQVELSSLELATADADLTLAASVTLRDDYPLEAQLDGELFLPEIMPELAGERFGLTLSGSLAALDAQLITSGQINSSISAQLDALDPTLPMRVSARAERLEWPLSAQREQQGDDAESPYALNDLVLRLEGSLLEYQAALSVNAEGPELPGMRLALNGNGDLEQFAWTPLSVTVQQGGSLISHGEVRWSEGLDVSTRLQLNNLDPGAFTDAVQGRLSGNAALGFAQSPEGWSLDVPTLSIRGELQELPLALDAELSGNSEMQWDITALDLRQGSNRLTAQGRVAERLDLSGTLRAPDLATLSPQLGGSLQGDFDVAGTLEAPQLRLDLVGDSLSAADNRLEQLTLSARVSGLDDPSLDATLEIAQLNASGQRFSSISLGLDGRLSAHRLELEALAGPGMPLSRAALALDGSMNQARDRYRASLSPLEVDSEHGDVRLDQPIELAANLDAGSVQVQPFCLIYDRGGRLCVTDTLSASGERGSAALAIRDLPMSLLEEFMPEGWSVAGETQAELRAEWAAGGSRWSLDLGLGSNLALSGLDAFGQPWELPASQLRLAVDATQARAEAQLDVSLADAGDIRLLIDIDDPVNQGPLSGRLVLDDIRLAPYQALVADMQTLEGSVTGDVAIGGSLAEPSLDGDIRLSGLEARGGDVPVEVRDGNLEILLAGDRADIRGLIAAEQGQLSIDGSASWPSADAWQAAITLDGRSDPLLAELPDVGRLRIAPNLSIEADPERLEVRGRVEVPWARLEIGQMPASAVTPSSDEIIISERDERRAQREEARAAERAEEGADEATSQALAEAGIQLDVQIDLALGPDMQLEAYGLESGLRGNLQVRQQTGPVQLFGEVNLVDGRFRAFGQDLLIRRGQLLFSGPADQPLLDFEAIRNPNVTEDDVIAGLRVTGAAEAPDLQVFSEPSMDEARALSYLLRGRAPGEGDADGALASALIGLSLSQTGGAVGQIGQAFGVDDLALETAGTGDESQVVVSGQLTDDLRVSYGVGIFSPIAELTLRYTLWRNLYLQAVSGAAQAVDLVYQFSLGRAEQTR
ncbi:translocation/assembly module TamB domain-containing protein [Franzmannia qiaohouensis]|uniref:Translocation/assembly module TamB n=1 Tax=Franzmannia qiaohouensis TaxID=1329370 RepID=A0ABU1HGG5_9GAMM|nr:translocation/assembly module TamB domain-containing protein [Halomonas qiaohouensis]MDR5905879.1 translocation/assembly module TamB [Halomonas qiaohouensis]